MLIPNSNNRLSYNDFTEGWTKKDWALNLLPLGGIASVVYEVGSACLCAGDQTSKISQDFSKSPIRTTLKKMAQCLWIPTVIYGAFKLVCFIVTVCWNRCFPPVQECDSALASDTIFAQSEVKVAQEQTAVSREELAKLLNNFKKKYELQEKEDPRQGYLVQFFVKDNEITSSLSPRGEKRNSNESLLSISQAKDPCPFCSQQLAKSPRRIENMTQRNTTDAVRSNNDQLLIVPKDHYSQWFDAPVEVQVDLLQEAIEIRKKYPKSQKRPIELHCGLGQTVFHLHVRTNIFV
jgi:hypothetical protein